MELGCGRGSISAYFADSGFECTLLDISPTVVETAQRVFARHGLAARFAVGDAYHTGFPDRAFDVVVSIGLLEHFEDLACALAEQVRLLDEGGLLLAYVVPENPDNVQKEYRYICDILALYDRALAGERPQPPKPVIYRSDAGSDRYLELLSALPMRDVQASGVYPLPMISPSVSFPFTLMPEPMEQILVRHFEGVLDQRQRETGRNPWLCDEQYGQAFLVWGWKCTTTS
jgi:SAM-dependent methyltransferase